MPRRYEREIMELLERKEREHRGRERIQRVRRNVHEARKRVGPDTAWQRLGGLRWIVASIVLAVTAFVFSGTIASVTNVLIIVAVGLFFVPFFTRSAGTPGVDDPVWRGQRIEPTPFPTRWRPFARLRRFLADVRRPRDQ